MKSGSSKLECQTDRGLVIVEVTSGGFVTVRANNVVTSLCDGDGKEVACINVMAPFNRGSGEMIAAAVLFSGPRKPEEFKGSLGYSRVEISRTKSRIRFTAVEKPDDSRQRGGWTHILETIPTSEKHPVAA